MAKTLIGNLILRIKAEGLGEGKQVISTMKDIEKGPNIWAAWASARGESAFRSNSTG